MAGSYIKLVWTFYERIRQIRASVLTFFGATAWAHLLQTELQSALTPSYLSHFSISNCNREPWPLLVSSGLRNYVRIHAYAYLNTQNVESTRKYARKWPPLGGPTITEFRIRREYRKKLVLPESRFYHWKRNRSHVSQDIVTSCYVIWERYIAIAGSSNSNFRVQDREQDV